MKIGIDARMLGPGFGLARYVTELVKHLESISPDADFVVFLRRENWNEYEPKNPRFKKVLADIPWYGPAEQLLLPRVLRKEKVDLMHFPHWNVPLGYNNPFVVTIHDLLLLHYPTREASTLGPVSYWLKNKIFRRVLNHAARSARHIITVSEFSRRDIVNTLGIQSEKISVTYQAPFTPHILQATNYKLNTPSPYILYVGVAYPHKNLTGLLAAWHEYEKKYGTDYTLVLAGKENFFYKRLLESPEWKKCQKVVYTGFVPDASLPDLYRGASLYVHPSLYEGYALPALEAMTFSLPVLSSNKTCLPEVLGKGALYADPMDPRAFAEAIHTALIDQQLRQTLKENAQRILLSLSGRACAEATWEVYKNSV